MRRCTTTLPKCCAAGEALERRAAVVERKHAVDGRQQPSGAKLGDDRVELGVVPHRRAQIDH